MRPSSRHVVIGLLVALALMLGAKPASADRVPQLSKTLAKSKHEKERIAAAVSLGRLRDKRGVKPLVHALGDHSRTVRMVAATALGHLGDPAALPALRRASKDKDTAVRKRAVSAIGRINKSAKTATAYPTKKRRGHRASNDRLASYRISGREAPRLTAEPNLHIVLKSTSDETRGKTSKKLRKRRAARLRKIVKAQLNRSRYVTTSAEIATKHDLEPYSIDVSVTKLTNKRVGKWVEVEAEIRIAISNDRGKMISFLTGGAKVQVPKATFSRRYLAQHQTEALENGVKSVYQDLLTYLRKNGNGS